ncbi:MAG: DNA-3-methyladenine glycosylase I [Rhodospirillales bacterium]|nr:DNA-3-methyladenine glycosylase I [Alphaproteobacteria bacterium]MBL6947857.1 DNA-3-methyladenine glycosylase I [Rhodospirillales bacterium]
MSWYCEAAKGNPIHESYHDTEYGFPLDGPLDNKNDERYLFELQSLELFQAGLSWELILKKRATTVAAFDNFDVDTVAAYGKKDTARLLNDAGIIRNKLKVASIIENANRIQGLRESHGGFAAWIAAHHPLDRDDWTKLFRKTFKFMGGEIVNEFLMCIGYLPGSHHADCPAYKRIAKRNPPWMQADPKVYGLSSK